MTDRELDALVAEHVFGLVWWCSPGYEGTEFAQYYLCAPGKRVLWRVARSLFETGQQFVENTPEEFGLVRCKKPSELGVWCHVVPYSSSGDGMLAVIEKLAGKFQIRIDGCNVAAHDSGLPRGCWGVTIAPWGTDPDDGRGAASPNLPRAVAIAALRALGIEVQG